MQFNQITCMKICCRYCIQDTRMQHSMNDRDLLHLASFYFIENKNNLCNSLREEVGKYF